ncbi:MAG: hypothetical protein NTV55_07810, partial [Planctomycetota bacterium]|nr:hypothetical protein [Planctomycetota bacterium]
MASIVTETRGSDSQGRKILEAIGLAIRVLRQREAFRGILWVTATLLVTLACLLLGVRFFGPGSLVLQALWLLGVGAISWLLITRLAQPLLFSMQPLYAAREIERYLPGCKNSLINFLDLRASNLHPAVKATVVQRALKDLEGVEVGDLMRDNEPPSHGKWILAAACGLVFLAAGMSKGSMLNRLSDALMPFNPGGLFNRTRISMVEPKTGSGTIRLGQDCLVRILLEGEIPAEGSDLSPELSFWHQEGGPSQKVLFLADKDADGRSIWSAVVHRDQVLQGFWYRVRAGDSTTPNYRMDIRLDAFLEKLEVQVSPAAYLSEKPYLAESPDLIVPAESTIDLTGIASQELKLVTLLFTPLGEARPIRIPGTVQPDAPRTLSAKLPALKDGAYSLELTTRDDDVAVTPPHTLKILPDAPPRLQIISPNSKMAQVRQHQSLDIQAEASDDHGLQSFSAFWMNNAAQRMPLPTSEKPVLSAKPSDHLKDAKRTWRINPQALPLNGGGTFAMQPGTKLIIEIQAQDHQPLEAGKAAQQLILEMPRTNTQIQMVQPEGGNKLVKKGQAVFFSARISGRIPKPEDADEPKLLLSRGQEDAPNPIKMAQANAGDGLWTCTLPSTQVQNGFWYQISAGDAQTSRYRVDVPAELKLKSVTGQIISPPYTGWKPRLIQERPIRGLRDSAVDLRLESTVPGTRGIFRFVGADGQPRNLAMVADPDKLASGLMLKFTLNMTGSYQLLLTADDQSWKDMATFPIEMVEDAPPAIVLTEPGKDSEASVTGSVSITGKATDDIGVQSVILRSRVIDGSDLMPVPYLKGKVLRDKQGLLPRELPYMEVLDFQSLMTSDGKPAGLKAGQVIEYWAEVRDAHPDPRHPSGESARFKITLKESQDQKKDEQQKKQEKEQKKEADKKQEEQQQNGQGQGQGEGDKPKDKPMPGEGDKPNEKPMPGQGDQSNEKQPGQKDPGMGEAPNQNQDPKPGDKPMPGDLAKPGQNDKPMPGDQPMPGQGDKPMPGEKPGDKPEPGKNEINELERRVQEALEEKPSDKPMPADKPGDKPMPGDKPGDKPTPGDKPGDKPMPGDKPGDKPMPGDKPGDKP